MKVSSNKYRLYAAALILVAATAVQSFAQQSLRLPRPSPKASVMQTIGVTDVTINYSRPGVKGRKIWGDAPASAASGAATLDDARRRAADAPIVPYGHVWRTGANEATTFTVTDDVLINGQKLAAGTYSLHTIPGRDEWTLIFNKDAGQWGSFTYDDKKDALRVKVKPQTGEMQEWLTFRFEDVAMNTARAVMHWERVMLPFTIEVDTVNRALANARAAIAAEPTNWRVRAQAASYAFENKVGVEEAMVWLDESIKLNENYNNLGLKARVMAGMGKTQEAITLGERAIQVGKAADAKLDTSAMERMLAQWRAQK